MSVKSTWIEGHKSVLDDGRNHSVVVDLPESSGGEDMGTSALELTNMSLAGCISTIFSIVASKMNLDIDELVVEIETSKSEETGTIDQADAEVKIESEEPKEKLEKCLEKTMDTCPVGLLYERAGVEVTTDLGELK